jgi:hypothetical protein
MFRPNEAQFTTFSMMAQIISLVLANKILVQV